MSVEVGSAELGDYARSRFAPAVTVKTRRRAGQDRDAVAPDDNGPTLIDPDIKTIHGRCSPLPEPADATNSGTRSPGQVVSPTCPSLRDRFRYHRCPTHHR